jgi:hypothetical protein
MTIALPPIDLRLLHQRHQDLARLAERHRLLQELQRRRRSGP